MNLSDARVEAFRSSVHSLYSIEIELKDWAPGGEYRSDGFHLRGLIQLHIIADNYDKKMLLQAVLDTVANDEGTLSILAPFHIYNLACSNLPTSAPLYRPLVDIACYP
jgi:hypothetical protein